MIRAALVALAFLAGLPPARAAGPPQQPILRIEAGGHTGAIPRLSVSADGHLMASAGYDKTVRLWSLPDGAERAVLRPPIGPREEGEIYAVALTPDGRRVFAAGATGGSWDHSFSIYLFSVATGRLAARLPGLPSPVYDLAVSPDGTRLVAGLAAGGVRVWDAHTGHALFSDTAYRGPVRAVAFDAGGDLFATGADGAVRAYGPGFRLLARRAPIPGLRPWGLAVSPDCSLIAVSFENAGSHGHLHLVVLAAHTLATVFQPDTAGLHGAGLLAVGWMADDRGGVRLLAGGYARNAGGNVIRSWADFGLGPFTDLPAAHDTIRDIRPLPGGGAVYAAEDPGWGRIAASGRIASRPAPPMADLRPARRHGLAVSSDGTTVMFATASGLLRFDAAARTLQPATGADPALAFARTSAPGVAVTDWKDTTAPRLNGHPLRLDHAEYSRSLALLPDGRVLLGTDSNLRLFSRAGRQIAAVPVPAAAWAVTVNAAGTIAVAALLDGTLRWYGLDPAAPLAHRATLFAHADGVRWVLFTPDGFFDTADQGGKTLVGFHLNRGANQQPEWTSLSQAFRLFYAPAVVRAALAGDRGPARARRAKLGDLRARLAREPQAAIASACIEQPDGSCAPLKPDATGAAKLPPAASRLRLALSLSDRGLGIGAIDLFVNGRNLGRFPAPATAGGKAQSTLTVPLDPGPNRVRVRVYDSGNTVFAETPLLDLQRPGGAARHRRMYILAIGIDHFALPSLALRFAVADAQTFVRTVRKAAAPLYDQVHVMLLTDGQATRAGILAAFDRLAAEIRPQDTFLFYVATHGVRDEDTNRFLLIPSDISDISTWESMARGAIGETALIGALARIRARDALLFIDTCHAGKVTADNLANVGHETGRYILAASSSVQEALDSYDNRNGVFVYAVREALDGKAPHDSAGIVSALSLGEYVAARVGVLARRKGHAQDAEFKAAQSELRSFPVGEIAK